MKLIKAAMLPLFLAGLFSSAHAETSSVNPESLQISRATFLADGEVKLPTDFHRWVHVGTFVKEDGINIFDNSKVEIPLIGNTYIEPSAYNHYMVTGEWADGSQIVKEFTEVEADKKCDLKGTHVCKTAFGTAIYQNNYAGYGYMVKDKQRFPKAAGNWAYFTTGHVKPPYPQAAKVKATADCAACHIAHAADQNYVFAAQKIGLERMNPNNK
ncbi:cytochrome P460 family protein [Enterobacteriaceae bacterium H16N7]|nr:cytochrome P460 family protein [Dryocola clanedunensis]